MQNTKSPLAHALTNNVSCAEAIETPPASIAGEMSLLEKAQWIIILNCNSLSL